MSLPVIAVVACNHFSPFHFSVPCIVFDDILPEQRLFDLKIYAGEDGIITSRHGLSLQAKTDFNELAKADVIVIPYWRELTEKPSQMLLDSIIKAHQQGSCIVGLCLGTYVLAYSGLLDQHRAATHWEFEQDFITRFTSVNLDTNALYVDDDRLITSAGTAAGLDCCLYIVRLFYGSAVANKIARRMVLPPHREGGQAQFIARPVPQSTKDSRINALLHYLRANIADDHRIDALAQRALMSRRTFTRQFKQATGISVGEWLIAERLNRCQELLESTSLPIDVIAEQVGFHSATALRQQFKQRFAVTPTEWRKNFRL